MELRSITSFFSRVELWQLYFILENSGDTWPYFFLEGGWPPHHVGTNREKSKARRKNRKTI